MAAPVAELIDSSPYAELKFSRLRTSGEGRQILAAIFESGLLDPQSARVVPVDKDWMVAGKMVDLLWEPGAARTHHFYASGMHRQLASVLQRQGPEEAGKEIWKRWQEAFIAAVRRPEREERNTEVVSALAAVKVSAAGQPVGILFEPVPDEAASLGELVDAGRDALEPALTGLVEQLHHWSQRLHEPFRVVHDDSNVVRRWHELLLRSRAERLNPPPSTSAKCASSTRFTERKSKRSTRATASQCSWQMSSRGL